MLKIINISRSFDDFSIKNISFEIKTGDYYIILGGSGVGKSLLLEIIAGLINPDSGKISINNRDITHEKIQKRKIGLVFQDYAVFPHMTVYDNIAYPLRRKYKKNQISEKVAKIAEEMNISNLLSRKPDTLSGGEKQRVALARTLVLEPDLLLLDEPLASLDIQLRDELRSLLRSLNKRGQTILHVTHQYEEAISLANKIAVLHEGEIIQKGTPREVFTNPKSEFVANFVGIKNFFKIKNIPIKNKNHREMVINKNLSILALTINTETDGTILIRNEDILISENKLLSTALNNFEGIIESIIPVPVGIEVQVNIGIKLYVKLSRESFEKLNLSLGKKVWISFKASSVKFIKN